MKTYYIFEKWAQCTHKGSRELRATDGFQFFDMVKAENEANAILQWLEKHSESYDIITYDSDMISDIESERGEKSNLKENAWYECASCRMVFEEGDTSADFGDFYVYAFTEFEVLDRDELKRATETFNLF